MGNPGALRHRLLLAVSTFLLDRVALSRRLRGRPDPHAPRSRTRRQIYFRAHHSLLAAADPGEPRSIISWYGWTHLPRRRPAAGSNASVCRITTYPAEGPFERAPLQTEGSPASAGHGLVFTPAVRSHDAEPHLVVK